MIKQRGAISYKHMLRAIHFSLRNLWRNISLTAMAIVFVILATYTLVATALLYRTVQHAVSALERGVVLTLILQPTVTDAQAADLVNELRHSQGIESAEYHNPDTVKADFLKQYGDNQELTDTFSVLPVNPLAGEVVIRASNMDAYGTWLQKFSDGSYASLVSNRNIADYQSVVDGLEHQVAEPIRISRYAVAGVFALITALLMFNTVRMTIYTQREEIGIMKLVGATDWFVRMPYLLQAIWLVVFGALIAYGLLMLTANVADPVIRSTFGWEDFSLSRVLIKDILTVFIAPVGVLGVIAMLSTIFSLRRYLKT